MSYLSELISTEFIFINLKAVTDREVLLTLSSHLENANIVKNTFKQAILEREQLTPTGLITKTIGVAIPHTDIKHVNKSVIAIGVLANPVLFSSMEDPEKKIKTELVFMLALRESFSHLNVLKELIEVLQNEELLKKIVSCTSPDELRKYLIGRC
ncbi:PTS sugar transporter subunit IIA [Viridibacillus arvi]|uniref:PTS sugar transporter subunit IIA n=1 Tax=Viridibacillus arvi TaxID=263475 RepID=UPI0036E57ECB